MTLQMTLFIPPNGEQQIIDVLEVNEEDKKFFIENNVKLSVEELGTKEKVLYADWGRKAADGEPYESMIILNPNTGCREAMAELCLLVQLEMEMAS